MAVIPDLDAHLHAQRRAFAENAATTAAMRIDKLLALHAALVKNSDALCTAVSADYGYRSPYETLHAEIYTAIEGIRYLRRRVRRWMRPRRRSISLLMQPARGWVEYQPLGVVGIIVPWNYPILLAISPLCYALAAGNRVMIKMSENAPATADAVTKMLAEVFEPDEVAVVQGGVDTAIAFSNLPFDHLLYTGSTTVGSKVMQAAAVNLTPVTLELGGKTPVVLDASADIGIAAERICFGKSLNAGQTCVSPDYVLCPYAAQDAFVAAYRAAYQHQFPPRSGYPDHSCIVNEGHYSRLQELLDDARAHGGEVVAVGDDMMADTARRRMPMQLVLGAHGNMRIMQEEIFGPVLPVVNYKTIDDAIEFINKRPRPLSLAVFAQNTDAQKKVVHRTHSGSVCLNDTIFHVPADDLPFGGVGNSGMGQYHGHEGFLRFTHTKAVFRRPRLNSARLLYPPYGSRIQKLVRKLLLR